MATTKTLTIRLSEFEYSAARKLAENSNKSLNQLAKDGLAHLAREARRQRLYEEFTELGEDSEEASIDFASEAQAETLD